jgi:uncharacterized repeat protein (TIGR03843 family)
LTPRVTSVPDGTASTSTEPRVTDATTLRALRDGDLEVLGRLPGSSNQALVVLVHHPDLGEPFHAVYKATRAERPLFDFPEGTLARREVAAFLVSEASGWGLVPPTVHRDGPFGEGMVQQWIHGDPGVDLVAMVVGDDPRLRRMAVFDAIVNNTDRKGGHLLPMPGGHVFGVDHGVTFSTVPKLRTVLWGWMGTPFAEDELAGLERVRAALAGELAPALRELLAPAEVSATKRRVATLLRTRRFPRPNRDWPAVPWPAF